MEEPLFAKVEEKPGVVKKKEKPTVGTIDLIDLTEIPINERPIATVSRSNEQNLHKNQKMSSFQMKMCYCGMEFDRFVDFIDHKANFKDRPHTFCKPCGEAVLSADFHAHLYRRTDGSMRPRCAVCHKEFANRHDMKKHDAFFKGRPHVFCKPCDLIVSAADHREHLKSNLHAAATTQRTLLPQNPSIRLHEPQNRTEVQGQRPIAAARRGRPRKEPPYYVMQPWEKAAGAQNAVDILLGNQPKVKMGGMKRGYQDVALPRLFYAEKDGAPIGPKQRFPCPVRECGHGFLVFDHLAEHMSQEHPGMKPLWCDLCPASFDATTKFWQHMGRLHGVSKPLQDPEGYPCEDCGRHFAKEAPYYGHRANWLGRSHAFCCNMEIKAEDVEKHKSSQRHIRAELGPVPCDGCGRDFGTWLSCKKHADAFGGTPHRFCEPCNATVLEDDWEKHEKAREHMMETLHVTEEEPKACEECGVMFRTKGIYVSHWERYGGRPHFHCEACKEVFGGTEEEHLGSKEHRRSIGETDLSLPWKCPVEDCGSVFKFEKFLIDHMAVHPGELPFACPQKFWYKAKLRHHLEQVHDSYL